LKDKPWLPPSSRRLTSKLRRTGARSSRLIVTPCCGVRAGTHARYSRLRREFSAGPNEVVQEFLVCKLFPAERARSLLGPVARGERPLRPRLLASLENHCIDLDRKGRRLPLTGGQVIDKPAAASHEPPSEEAVRKLIGLQLGLSAEHLATHRHGPVPRGTSVAAAPRLGTGAGGNDAAA